VEGLGALRLVHGHIGGSDFVVSVEAAHKMHADATSIEAAPGNLHLFGPSLRGGGWRRRRIAAPRPAGYGDRATGALPIRGYPIRDRADSLSGVDTKVH
jgi:hypothetical protein